MINAFFLYVPDLPSFRFGLFSSLPPSFHWGRPLSLLIFKVLDLRLSPCDLQVTDFRTRRPLHFLHQGDISRSDLSPPLSTHLAGEESPLCERTCGHAKDELWGRAPFPVQILAM